MVKEIPLQNGMVALVDDEDFTRCSKYLWIVHETEGYPTVSTHMKKQLVTLSRFILSLESDSSIFVTQLGDNPLNFTKNNLLIVNKTQKQYRSRGWKNSTSKYKGVFKHKCGKWQSNICVNKTRIYIGLFETEDEAAEAYNEMAIKHFGEHAYLNDIGGESHSKAKEIEITTKKQKRTRNETGFKGVRKRGNKYHARVYYNKETIFLGSFSTVKQAAMAYDKKSYEFFGDEAVLNFPELIDKYKVNQI